MLASTGRGEPPGVYSISCRSFMMLHACAHAPGNKSKKELSRLHRIHC